MASGKKNSERRNQIEKHATKLFEQRGFPATSMRDLALGLKIEAASLYSHINSKEDILHSICFKIADKFFNAFNEALYFDRGAAEKLEAAIIAHVKIITDEPSEAAVFFSEWRHLSEPALSEFLEMRNTYERNFRQLIDEGVEKKEFDIPDSKFTVRMLLSSINWIHAWYSPEGLMTSEEIGKKIADIFINGIKKEHIIKVN